MSEAEADLLIALISLPAGALIVYFAGWIAGRDAQRCHQTRENAVAAQQMRAAVRDLDDRVSTFAILPTSDAQSHSLSATAETRSTAIVSPPARRCIRGPERCYCDECVARGVPPSP